MFLSYNLLKQFCDIKVSPDKLSELLTAHSFEVEGVKELGANINKIVVGKILSVEKHPNADRLSVCVVKVSANKKLQIICGAPNVEAGQKVPVALVGAVLPNGMNIEEREVRGVKSNGMICAEDELGLGEDHDGIMVLDSSLKVGQSFVDALKLKDYLIDVDNKTITNRPDLWGHVGVAREISAILGSRFKYKESTIRRKKTKDNTLRVDIKDYNKCSRYMGVRIDDIEVGPSPQWLKNKLLSFGVRSINNIVDITNYVMIEVGQPMHAFDADKIYGSSVIVRNAKDGEKVLALDEEEYKLNKTDIVIADKKNVIAIAGIMGGQLSGVDSHTKSIVLESANFDPINTRKTSTRLHLRSESSMRFEKGLDPSITETALNRAVELILELMPDVKINNIVDNKKIKIFKGPIKISIDDIKSKSGIDVSKKDVVKILKRLGFGVSGSGDVVNVAVPSWRGTGDIRIAEDIIEEVVRIYGYDNVNPAFPMIKMKKEVASGEKKLIEKSKDILSRNMAMNEVYNYSFNGTEQLEKIGVDCRKYIKLENPASEKQDLMRQSLIPNLLNSVLQNIRNFEDFAIFEVGSIFLNKRGDKKIGGNSNGFLPKQDNLVSGFIVSNQDGFENIFYKTKELIRSYFGELGFNNVGFMSLADNKSKNSNFELNLFHPTRSVFISVNNKIIGVLGESHPLVLSKLGINKRIGSFEINLSNLLKIKQDNVLYVEKSRFPVVERDMAFVLNNKILYNDFVDQIKKTSNLISRIELFDVYEDSVVLGDGKKSMAFHIDFQSDKKTLTSNEVDAVQGDIINAVGKRFNAQIRD